MFHAFGPRLLFLAGLLIFLAVLLLPLGGLAVSAIFEPPAVTAATSDANQFWSLGKSLSLLGSSAALAAIVALVAVLLGFVPGRLLAAARRGRTFIFWLLLAPLMLPSYLLYYVWSLPLSPTAELGRWIGDRPELARAFGSGAAMLALVLWYWPLAALLLAHGWRQIDPEVHDGARLEAGPWTVFTRVTLPLLARPLLAAFAVCFTLAMSDFGAFHLAGVQTLGTELKVLFDLTGSPAAVARGCLPLVIVAAAVTWLLARDFSPRSPSAMVDTSAAPAARWQKIFFAALMVISLLVPLGLLVTSVRDLSAWRQFWQLQHDGLAHSILAAVAAAGLATIMATAALATDRFGRLGRGLGRLMQLVLLLAVFLPGSLLGVAILKGQTALGLGADAGAAWWHPASGWWALAAGQAARFAGVGLVMLLLVRDSRWRELGEMAEVDGAGPLAAWWHVRLPLSWPLVVGSGLLVAMLCLTELQATLILLPPGLPNFTQRLLNQMHYARDQHVIASCLLLVAVYLVLALAVALLQAAWSTRAALLRSGRNAMTMMILAAGLALAALGVSGCEDGAASTEPQVVRIFGSSGDGPGELTYPRPLDLDAAGNLYVADKTGRIQHLSPAGTVLSVIKLPAFQTGKPTGLSVGPDGNLYVADTHYHRILVYSPAGEIVRQFGEFGTGPGQFIYPTDIAFYPTAAAGFAAAGRLFVSEYGDNDRISIFTREGRFLDSFGRLGSGPGELSRPESLCVDPERKILYVADACNHRIAKYTLDGKLVGYLGSVGSDPGQLRYPYSVSVVRGGKLAVCEYGNNRLQLLDPDDGRSLRCLGRAGRGAGELAYPWALVVNERRQAFISDSGNNRIQVWQF